MRRARTSIVLLAAAALAGLSAPAAAYQLAEGLTANGRFFFDATLSDTDANSGFHNKRNYIVLRAQVDPKMAFHFTLDQRSEADRVFVKYSYLQRMVAEHVTVRGGMMPTPYAPFDNGEFWGLRFVEQAFTQYWGALTTADLGMAVAGSVPGETALTYDVALMNGEGFQNTPDGEGFALAAHLGAEVKQLHLGVFLHEEANRGGVSTNDPSREGLYAFWDDPRFRVGGQVVRLDDGGAGPTAFDGGEGFNVQGRVKLPSEKTEAWAFGRYDWIDPADADTEVSLVIVGVAASVGPKLRVAPNVRRLDDGTDTQYMALLNAELNL
jgi:hypothetical protein